MSATLTGSGIYRALQCPASVVLPQANVENVYSGRGTDKHAYLARIQDGMSPEESLALVPPESRDICAAIELDKLPAFEPGSFAAEVAFAYDVASDTAREIGRNIGRNYGELAPSEIPLTIDLVALVAHDSDAVFVGDYKGQHAKVQRAKDNAQLKAAARAACLVYGRSKAFAEIIRLRDDGSTWRDVAEFDAFDLDLFAGELRALTSTIADVRAQLAAGAVPRVSIGDWCRYCPAVAACPGQTGLIRAAAADPERSLLLELTPETAQAAYIRVRQVDAALKVAKAALHRYAFTHPIRLPDGSIYGPTDKSRDSIAGAIVHDVLTEKYGLEVANLACEFESTKKGIDRAMRRVLEAKKRAGEPVTLKALNAEALDLIRARGGITTNSKVDVAEHRPEET